MGKQVNFFMLPADETEFLNFIKSTDKNVLIYPYRSPTITFRPIKIPPKHFSTDFWFHLWLYNPNFGEINYSYIKEQKHYYVDEFKSPVIEFSRCGINDKSELSQGRLWIATAYVIKDNTGKLIWQNKPLELINWYEKIARWIKKKYIKIGKGQGAFYVTTDVVRWVKKGGGIVGAIVAQSDIQKIKNIYLETKGTTHENK